MSNTGFYHWGSRLRGLRLSPAISIIIIHVLVILSYGLGASAAIRVGLFAHTVQAAACLWVTRVNRRRKREMRRRGMPKNKN